MTSSATPASRFPRRVAISGMGVVSAIGRGVPNFRRALLDCRSGIAERTLYDETYPSELPRESYAHLAAAVEDVAPGYVELEELSTFAVDRFAAYAVMAANEALRDAGFENGDPRRKRAHVILGSAVGGDQSRDFASHRIFGRAQRPHPLTVVRTMLNAGASAISIAFGLTGPVFSICSACASAAHAIGQGAHNVRFGLTDCAIAGGAETLPAYTLFRSWQQMRVMSRDGCRPFAADRNGLVLGEGAGILVLEPLDLVLARGGHVYAEVAGFGTSSDARDWVIPDAGGMTRCMEEALADAEVDAAQIAYVNAHGTATDRGDAAETEALGRLLGKRASRVPVSSTKALHGHALGATAALEAIATAIGLDEGWMPAMPAFERDPQLDLELVTGCPQPLRGEIAISNSFGFGGLNASLVLRRVPH
jgi:nodulation protein E